MTRSRMSSKQIFVLMAVVFMVLLIYASIDIASRTTFPGSKPQLQERILKNFSSDSVVHGKDSVKKNN